MRSPFRRTLLAAVAGALAAPSPLAAQRLEPPALHRATSSSTIVGLRFAPMVGRPTTAPADATFSRKLLQAAGATVVAAVVGTAAYQLARDPHGDKVVGDESNNQRGNVGYALGSAVGATLGAYVIGRGDGSQGSVLATAVGATLPALGIYAGRRDPIAFAAGVLFLTPLEGVGATVGYQASRTR